MTKKKSILLIITAIVIGILAGIYFIIYLKPVSENKFKDESECQDFIDECHEKVWSYRVGGGHEFTIYQDGTSDIDEKYNEACPKDCSRYTEKHGYFKDKQKQQKYYDKKVKECNKEYEKCIKNGDCRECDKYGQPIYYWD